MAGPGLDRQYRAARAARYGRRGATRLFGVSLLAHAPVIETAQTGVQSGTPGATLLLRGVLYYISGDRGDLAGFPLGPAWIDQLRRFTHAKATRTGEAPGACCHLIMRSQPPTLAGDVVLFIAALLSVRRTLPLRATNV